ncbi:hypothetical protein N7532_009873 [Penicillium argentinense]|uniref:Uncharacterized protein n=1 Tax=Penicillium argentinense TaxID=1131581 RepID=A0A9W9ENK3_9EURO|nr:uncharacterized protein N7532_009873 [Penicillium argentinense]KAJ5085102.1 hypothetical protein N7532_009873 [Penicillium argentinense]
MSDPTLYLYTSLTAGSSHIVTATARVETILKANKLPFRAIDVATDEAARKLWGRRSKGKKLPGLVKYGNIIGPPFPSPCLTSADPTPVQDLEEIEEWNEFGELRLVVNSVQEMDGMPATSNPLPATQATSEPATTPKEPEPATPKPSTIKIQSPPAKTEEKKDESAVLALRQASQEAASQAKNKSDEKKAPKEEKPAESPKPSSPVTKAHRGSVAPELPDTAPDSPKTTKRPALVVPEEAAVSSANFHAENADLLGLVEHHRGSIISATDKAEQDKMVTEIRQSVTGESQTGNLDALREEAAQKKAAEEPIVEEPKNSETSEEDAKAAAEKKEEGGKKEEAERKGADNKVEEQKEDAAA